MLTSGGRGLDTVDRVIGLLLQVLDPCLFHTRVVLGRLDKIHEVDDVRFEPGPDLLVDNLAVGTEAVMACDLLVPCHYIILQKIDLQNTNENRPGGGPGLLPATGATWAIHSASSPSR